MVGVSCCVDGNLVAINCWSEIPGGISVERVATTSVWAKVMLGATVPVGLSVVVGRKLLQDAKITTARTNEITVLLMTFTFPCF
jgi:hypothetical protein